MASSSSNVVGVHYRVGKKIGEGSFGVLFEGTNLLNNQQVAIKFVSIIPAERIVDNGNLQPETFVLPHRKWEHINKQRRLLDARHKKKTFLGRIRTPSLQIATQEPRKSDAPQLRDEYRTYKILVGCRTYTLKARMCAKD
jgi:serine/threonine protein kinase